ncbi:MAG: ABC transporter substrate-binding protein [Hyphomicrobiales bacterium]|nr:ABC transporter substrate-binding protein [Hyphomicrobiales bacterium]
MSKTSSTRGGINRRTVLAGTASLIAAPWISSRAQAQAKQVNIGVIMPLSGANAQFGINSRNGIELVADEINAAGGIKALGGAKINLIIADATSTPTTAGTVAQRMISQNEVTAILGAFASSLTIAISEVTERRDIPLLTMSFADQITGRGFKNIFQVVAKASALGKETCALPISPSQSRRRPAPRSTRSRSCMKTRPMAPPRLAVFARLPRRPISSW